MKRLAILAHFDPHGAIDDYVVEYVRGLRTVADRIVLVSTCPLSASEQARSGADRVICRENSGYDFMSWKVGLTDEAAFDEFDELILCNDSVYGPIGSLMDVFARMERRSCDFWAMTANEEIMWHLQSYFVVYRRRVLDSEAFRSFWSSFHGYASKAQLVLASEVGITQVLGEAGCHPDAAYSRSHSDKARSAIRALRSRLAGDPIGRFITGRDANPALLIPDRLLSAGIPLVKTSIFRRAPAGLDIRKVRAQIERISPEWNGLIDGHLARTASGRGPVHVPLVLSEPASSA